MDTTNNRKPLLEEALGSFVGIVGDVGADGGFSEDKGQKRR